MIFEVNFNIFKAAMLTARSAVMAIEDERTITMYCKLGEFTLRYVYNKGTDEDTLLWKASWLTSEAKVVWADRLVQEAVPVNVRFAIKPELEVEEDGDGPESESEGTG